MKQSSSSHDQDIIQILKDLDSIKAEYPPELLAARRAAFMDQVLQRTAVEVTEGWSPKNQHVIEHLRGLKSIQAEYPSKLWTARRFAFRRQIARMERIRLWQSVRSAIQSGFAYAAGTVALPSMKVMRMSLVVAAFAVVAFMGFLLQENRSEVPNTFSSQNGISKDVPSATTATSEARIICKPGSKPPLCLAREFDKSRDLIYPGNGSARPAVAKDTIPGHGEVHRASYINDGLYGPGASWVSNSADSWIKIDLGRATALNTVAFGRDRLGKFNDRDPGQFVIAVALSDDVYANGNSRNDNLEYTQVYDSEEAGFSGLVSGSETVEAQFQPLVARFIKITFENPGTAIDEVEIFMVQPPVPGSTVTKKPRDEQPGSTSTPIPTNTPLPTDTLTPIPTNAPLPTDTLTPIPTNTPLPTDTLTPRPTLTPLPTDTSTPRPTLTPLPTDTPVVGFPTERLESEFVPIP
ncbi:MAG: hypothetical protein ABI621_18530 [Chloroflexota bacterium]